MILNILAAAQPALAETRQNSDPARFVPLDGSYNTRSLGGYPAADGKQVRPGLIYRSDDLAHLSDDDLKAVDSIGIKSVIDFRSMPERGRSPNRIAPGVRHEHPLTIDAASMIDFTSVTPKNAEHKMEETNRVLVRNAQRQYRQFFELISNPENLPALFHCSAGKDRTGLAAALLLSALGVDRDTIYRDYLISAENLRGKYDAVINQNPAMGPLFTVKKSYLEAAFDEIDTNYGGVENYLTKYLHVDIAKLRELYLE